ncbi:MAG: hypothetical protein IKF24_03855 [Eubacterium sp.]|nr:hypothetical protein [Eubacterium sp.]
MDIIFDKTTSLEILFSEQYFTHKLQLYENYLKRQRFVHMNKSLSSIDYEKVTTSAILNNFYEVAVMEVVKTVKEDAIGKYQGKNLTEKIKGYFHSFDQTLFNDEYGEFLLSNSSAKSIVHHSFNKVKGYALNAVKEVLQSGKAIFYKQNYKNNKDRMLIVAPIEICIGKNQGKYMMGVSVEVTHNNNSVELIEVVIEKGESTDSFDTIVSSPVNNDSPSILTLLQQVIDVKNGKLSLDKVTAIGIDSE